MLVFLGFRSLIADERSVDTCAGRDPLRRMGTAAVAGGFHELSADARSRRSARTEGLPPSWSKAFQEAKDADSARPPLLSRWPSADIDPPLSLDAIDVLAAALNDSDGDARISAIWALGSPGATSASSLACSRSTNRAIPESGKWSCTRSARCLATRRP